MTADRAVLIGEGGALGVLLVHGLGGTPTELTSLARGIAATGATVLCCQLAGHCGSADDLRATTWHDWYDSVEAALARLERSCRTVVAGGLSMGALLAARLAREQPTRVHGLVMLAPTLRYDGWAMPWYGFLLRALIHTPIGRRYSFVEREPYGVKDERIRRRIVQAMRRGESDNAGLLATPSQALQQMWRLSAEVRGRLGQIAQDTLIIHSRQDDIASLSNAFELQARLGGRVEVLVLEDSFHLVTLDRQRGLVTQRVAQFACRLGAARACESVPRGRQPTHAA